MAARQFTFRMASEGAQTVIADLRAAAAESVQAERALQALVRASPQLASVQDGVQAKMQATARSMQAVQVQATGLGAAFGRGGAIGVGIAAATAGFHALDAAIGGIPRAGDAALSAIGRLTAAIGSDNRARSIFQDLQGVSRQTGVAVTDTAATFQRFAIAAKDIGTTNAQVVQLVEGIQKFGIVAGASTEEVSSATVQIGQALASGKLQGDELRSVLESMPQLAQALAKELNTSVGNLKTLGAEGKLTSDTVMPALLRAVQGIDKEFANLPVSMGRAQQQFDVSAQSFLTHIDQAIGLSQKLASILGFTSATLDTIRRGIGGATRDELKSSLERELVDVTGQLNKTGNSAPGVLAPFRPGGRIDTELKEKLSAREQEIRAHLLRINNEIVLEVEADFEIAQANRLTARTSALTDARNKILDEIEPRRKLTRTRDERNKINDQSFDQGVIDSIEHQRTRVLIAEEYADALKKLESSAKGAASGLSQADKAARESQKAFDTAAKDAKAIEAALDPAAAAWQRLEENLTRIRSAVSGGFISGSRGEQLEQTAYAKLAEDINKIGKEADEAEKDIDRFFQSMASKTEEAIVNWKGLGNVINSIGNDIARLLVRRTITNPLAELGMSGARSIFDWFGGLFSNPAGALSVYGQPVGGVYPQFASGGIMSPSGPLPLNRYSSGGIADRPQLALFGEGRMNEAFVPVPDGRRIPVDMRGGGSGAGVVYSTTFNVTVNVPNTNASPQTIAAVTRRVVAEEQAKFINKINQGGPMAKVVGRR